jgi:hypothetical protein
MLNPIVEEPENIEDSKKKPKPQKINHFEILQKLEDDINELADNHVTARFQMLDRPSARKDTVELTSKHSSAKPKSGRQSS